MVERPQIKKFYVQMRCLGEGPWPPLLEIEADTICIKDKKIVFKIDGEITGEVTGLVDAWWESP